MEKTSFVYRNIRIYRIVMNVLYLGGYKKRFQLVSRLLKDLPPGSCVVELCFGDIYLAEYCKKSGYRWYGFDLNKGFVEYARSVGYEASVGDVMQMDRLQKGNVCVMMGSLYHFHRNVESILSKMLDCAETVIVSEPVKNLSNMKGLAGFFAKRSADAGNGTEAFRYDRDTLLSVLKNVSGKLNFRYSVEFDEPKDIVIKLERNG